MLEIYAGIVTIVAIGLALLYAQERACWRAERLAFIQAGAIYPSVPRPISPAPDSEKWRFAQRLAAATASHEQDCYLEGFRLGRASMEAERVKKTKIIVMPLETLHDSRILEK